VEALAQGFGLLEAPCAAGDGSVCFSDVLGGGVYRWSPGGAVETVIPKRRGVGGMCLHADGGLVVSGRDLVHVRDGESRALLELEGVTGFNDLTAAPDGSLYVGALRFRPFAGEDPVPGDIWHLAADGTAERVLDDVDWPNGIGVSADGGTVYVCDYASGEVRAHELESGGSVVFARSPSGDADGLAMDAEGGVWVALGGGGGVGRFSPGGELEQVLDVPADFVSSLCFGGQDGRELFVTTTGTLFRARVDVAGLPLAAARV
jgi:sugar lactone lactonase YvrE